MSGFKKVRNTINDSIKNLNEEKLEEFIAEADTQKEPDIKESETSREKKQKRVLIIKDKTHYIHLKVPVATNEAIKERVKNAMSINDYMRRNLLVENEYFKDRDLLEIVKKAQFSKIKLRSFIRCKLKLDNELIPSENEQLIKKILCLSEDDKANIIARAKEVDMTVATYNYMKIVALEQLYELFTFEELMALRQEAEKYNLEFKEFLKLKVLH